MENEASRKGKDRDRKYKLHNKKKRTERGQRRKDG
jgi:hypothetical protein